ncbi:MAG: aldo/keto reductase [Eubacteriales bacterium]|nr:aldo/keto reductase [Eubacteriales bacterium]
MENLTKNTVVELYNRVKIPIIGFGGGDIDENHQKQTTVIRNAIEAGYRHFDTALIYHSERSIGEAIKESGIDREKFFITSKAWDADMRRGPVDILRGFEESLRRLGTDYIDLYLLHWPVTGKTVDTWRILELLYYTGKVRALGLSNVKRHHFVEIMRNCDVMPHVQQDEFSPYCMNNDGRKFDDFHGIKYEAMMPLKRLKYEKPDGIIGQIAEVHGKSIQQIVLRWIIQHGVVALPKSQNPKRMRENLEVFDFVLSEEEMARIDSLNFEGPINWDPDLFDF